MPKRISIRRVGASTGKLMAVPDSLAELLENATKKLKLPSGAKSIRTEKGDEVEDDADVALLRDDEVVFVLCGEEEFPLPGAAAAEPGPSAAVIARSCFSATAAATAARLQLLDWHEARRTPLEAIAEARAHRNARTACPKIGLCATGEEKHRGGPASASRR